MTAVCGKLGRGVSEGAMQNRQELLEEMARVRAGLLRTDDADQRERLHARVAEIDALLAVKRWVGKDGRDIRDNGDNSKNVRTKRAPRIGVRGRVALLLGVAGVVAAGAAVYLIMGAILHGQTAKKQAPVSGIHVDDPVPKEAPRRVPVPPALPGPVTKVTNPGADVMPVIKEYMDRHYYGQAFTADTVQYTDKGLQQRVKTRDNVLLFTVRDGKIAGMKRD